MSIQDERYRILHRELRERVIPYLGDRTWITAYQSPSDEHANQARIFCGLIPNRFVQDALNSHKWDIYMGDFAPSLSRVANSPIDSIAYRYDRYGGQEYDIEPLIIERDFDEIHERVIEVSQEFRLFHNLLYDEKKSSFVKFDITGEALPVVRMFEHSVEVDRKHIRQFLGAKQMSLALYFESTYYSTTTLGEMEILAEDVDFEYDRCLYRLSLTNLSGQSRRDYMAESHILGKKIVTGLPIEKCGKWPLTEKVERKFAQFIIDVDSDDEPVYFTSDPERLRNLFGKNPDAPLYQTPVFFRRTVLGKYYSEPTRYRVIDGELWCGEFWRMRIDNNHASYLIAMLGDLGRDLPESEQAHWMHHNVVPDGTFSRTAIARWFDMEWVDPEDSALLFQQTFHDLALAWSSRFGWHPFLPLPASDSHHFNTLRRPLFQEPTEFHEIVLSLSIVLQDRINKKEIGNLIPGFQKKDANGTKKNIPVLAEFLESENFPDADHYVEYLRMLQLLRSNSGTVHPRNEKEYRKAVKFFSLDSKSTIQVADDIFTTLTDFLDSLRQHFCPDDPD